MKAKVKKLVDEIAAVMKWPGTRAIVLQHFAEKDVYDPKFSITFDVFHNSPIPERDERKTVFNDVHFFESSMTTQKDRFMMNDLPVRISYKSCSRVDGVLDAVDSDKWLSMEQGTYLFHRIVTGSVIWSRDEWMKGVLERLDQLPESFWSTWIDSCQWRLDHLLGDMGVAAIKDDPLYFRLSLSNVLKTVAESLFAINHVFEPGPRDYTATLDLLETVPAGFQANWGSLLRNDAELPPERKREIANLLARGIFALIP